MTLVVELRYVNNKLEKKKKILGRTRAYSIDIRQDLFAFEIKSLEQTSAGPHLQMKPLGEFRGGLIGAMDINEAFDVFLRKAWKPIGEASNDPQHILEGYKQRDFINAHRRFDEYKTSFNENEYPRPIEFNETVGVASIPKAGIDCGVLDLST